MDPTQVLATQSMSPTTAGPLAEEQQFVLLWVHTGTATVEVSGLQHRLAAGEAIWVPPGIVHSTRTSEGAVVLPIFAVVGEVPDALSRVRTITIPPGWEDWLILQHVESVHIGVHLRGAPAGVATLLNLIGDDLPHLDLSGMDVDALPMPHSPAARSVARGILLTPGSVVPAVMLAEREHVSVKTLQRQFRQETGMVLSHWRTRARILAAVRHLTAGRGIGWTRERVGFVTAAGFTKAFRRYVGSTPRDYVRLGVGHSGVRRPDPSDAFLEQAVALVEGTPPRVPVIPPRRTWPRVHECHVLLWAHRGEAEVRIGARDIRLRQGEAVWLPAGVPNAISYAANSLAVPVGNSYSRARLDVDDLAVFTVGEDSTALLLYSMVVEYTLFQATTGHWSFPEELFRAQAHARREGKVGSELTGAVAAVAQALHRDPADSRSLAQWAVRFRTSSDELGAEFRRQSGTSFPQWRAQLRMDQARVHLHFGDRPGEVATRLGYASSAAFANAFAAAHQMSAREYQRRARLTSPGHLT